MSEELEQYIIKHKNLFWYTPKDKILNISSDLLVENILNYGTLTDVKDLIKIMGIKPVSDILSRPEIGLHQRRKEVNTCQD